MYVAIVSCLEHCNKISEDLALKGCLENFGALVDIVAWDDKTINWKKYNIAILRSAWGYHKNYKDFLKWLGFLDDNNIHLINDTNIVRWNINKEMQFNTLAELKSPIIDFVIEDSSVDFDKLYKKFNTQKLVCKPIVSASGDDTYVINAPELKNNASSGFIKKAFENSRFIIQPFIENICDGEYALVFINGDFSHAVRRFPGIFAGKKTTEYILPKDIPENIMNMAVDVSQKIKDYFGKNPVYARYDIVKDGIMETELAEPDLMTRNIPVEIKENALKKFADIVCKGFN